jgi:hypothetical protein
MAKQNRTDLQALATDTNIIDNTVEAIEPIMVRDQLENERDSAINQIEDGVEAVERNGKKTLTITDPPNRGDLQDNDVLTNKDISLNGFIDYNDSTGAFAIQSDTWTDLPNNGAGAFTNKNFPPNGVSELLDTATGYIDVSELELGDNVLIRNDYTINPNTNNAQLRFRYELGSGAGTYTLEKIVGRLDSGSGQDYRFSLTPDLIYMGDLNTRNNPIKLQIYCTSNATVTNAGTVITVVKR